MQTIIAPTTSNSDLVSGVFFNDGKFINKHNDELSNTWVCFCFWSNQNSRFGSEIANLRTANFCTKYGIENKKW